MDIKEVAQALELKKQDPDDGRFDIGEFAEALIAELAKQNKPVAWVYYPRGAGEKYVTYTDPASLDLGKQADRIAYIEPLYTFPPTAEQIANETAEAIARMLENGSFLTPESRVALAANGAAKAIRNGAWKEFKK